MLAGPVLRDGLITRAAVGRPVRERRAARRHGPPYQPGAKIPPPLRLLAGSRSRAKFRHKPSILTNRPAPIRRGGRTRDSEPTLVGSALADAPKDSDTVTRTEWRGGVVLLCVLRLGRPGTAAGRIPPSLMGRPPCALLQTLKAAAGQPAAAKVSVQKLGRCCGTESMVAETGGCHPLSHRQAHIMDG